MRLHACETGPRDFLLTVEADDGRQAPARPAIRDAVEIDEADGLVAPVYIADTRAETRGHERQVRVRVLRLDGALLARQVFATMELIVFVARAFRKHGAERLHVRRDGVALARQSRRKALFEVSRRRVKRMVEVS